jgi:cytochrome c oxidase cbb3-type subunit 2
MGVLPGIALSQIPPGPGVVPLTEIEAEGREVYIANGCSYCHTQQVRPLAQDKQFGRPSTAGDFAYQTPELLGSERTGPDLTNVGARQPSAVWQYIHLYNPRAVVPASIMPSFAFLFDVVDSAPPGVTPVSLPKAFAPEHGVVVPRPEAKALLAYLLSLKQAPLTGAQADTTVPKPAAAVAPPPAPATEYDAAAGEKLFVDNCSACHQATGEGLPETFPPLKGNAAVNDDDPATHLHAVLFGLEGAEIDGVTYESPMPAFGDMLSDAEIANIINYERSAWGNHGKPVTAAEVAATRAKGK